MRESGQFGSTFPISSSIEHKGQLADAFNILPFFPNVKKNAANVPKKKVGTKTKCRTGINTDTTAMKKHSPALVRAAVKLADLEKYLTVAEPKEFFPFGPITKSLISWSIAFGEYLPKIARFSQS